MPAVVFGPDRAMRRFHPAGPADPAHPRIGLVLGAGGVLGAAWTTGALARLQDRLPGPAADVDLIVGTSAGSVLAAALRCRASLDEMVAWQCGDASGILSDSVVLAAQDGPLPPLPHLRLGSLPPRGRPCCGRFRCPRGWGRAAGCRTAGVSTRRSGRWSARCTGVITSILSMPPAPGPRRTGLTATPGSRRWTTTPGGECCSAIRMPPARRFPMPWSPPARSRAV